LQPGKPVAVGCGEAVTVDVGGEPPSAVSEVVTFGLGVGVSEGVRVTVGVAVTVGVGVRVSGRNEVAVGPKVGVALGSGEGRAAAPEVSGNPPGAELSGSLKPAGVLGSKEANGPSSPGFNIPGRTTLFDEYTTAVTITMLTPNSTAKLINPARLIAILRLCFFETI
jgi:hypothetical protein